MTIPPPTVPDAPGGLPVIGHGVRLLRDPVAWLERCRSTADILRLRLGRRPAYLLCRAPMVHEVLVTQSGSFDKTGPFFEQTRAVIGDSLFTASNALHPRQRRLMQPAFTRARIADAVPVMAAEAEAMRDAWQPGATVDMIGAITGYVHRVALRTLLPTLDPAEIGRLADATGCLLAGLFRRTALPLRAVHRLPLPANRRFDRALAQLQDACTRALAAARASPDPGTILDALLTAGDDGTHAPFSEEELCAQLLPLLVASADTTVATLCWLLQELSRAPDFQHRLHEEVDAALGGRTPAFEDLARLPFLRALTAETLRHHPPQWMLTRTSIREVRIGPHHFAADTDFYFSPHQIQHAPGDYPHPQRFDPDRWSERVPTARDLSYLPFSSGTRKCLGDHFALASIAVAASAVAARWTLVPASGTDARRVATTVQTPVALHLTVRERPHP